MEQASLTHPSLEVIEPSRGARVTIPLTTAVETAPPSAEDWNDVGVDVTPDLRFFTSYWFEAWGEHLLHHRPGWRGPLRYLTARDDQGRLVGVLPFATQLKARVQFVALGGYFVPFRGYPVAAYAADIVARAFAEHLTDYPQGVGIRLGPVADNDPLATRLPNRLRELGWRFVPMPTEGRQIVHLPQSFAEYEASLSASELKNIRRRERKMQRERRVEIKLRTTETCDDWDHAIRDMASIEEQSWLPKAGGDLHFPGEENRAFWNALLNARRTGLAARVWILHLDGTPAAYDFNIDSGSCRYSLFAHYAHDAKGYRPGFLLMLYEVEDAIKRGLRTIDLGAGDPGYKGFWCAKRQGALLDTIAFPPGLRGMLLSRLAAALPKLERGRALAGGAAARTTTVLATLLKSLQLKDV